MTDAGCEYQIEASIRHQFGQYGSIPSYNSIVASGDNACTLHYVENQSKLKQGDLLLTDAGCEYQMYASDTVSYTHLTLPTNREV